MTFHSASELVKIIMLTGAQWNGADTDDAQPSVPGSLAASVCDITLLIVVLPVDFTVLHVKRVVFQQTSIK